MSHSFPTAYVQFSAAALSTSCASASVIDPPKLDVNEVELPSGPNIAGLALGFLLRFPGPGMHAGMIGGVKEEGKDGDN